MDRHHACCFHGIVFVCISGVLRRQSQRQPVPSWRCVSNCHLAHAGMAGWVYGLSPLAPDGLWPSVFSTVCYKAVHESCSSLELDS